MATWAIGDVHGCYRSLRELLARPEIAPADRLWFVGDLVNRGPRSLETLRFVRQLGERATVVLGNHDLHLLARAAGVAEPRRFDQLEGVLDAPDLPELVDWLSTRPLLVREEEWILVHAGVDRRWSADESVRRASLAAAALRGEDAAPFLASYRPGREDEAVGPGVDAETLADLRILTLMRTVDGDGAASFDYSGPLAELPTGRLPWFDAPGRQTRSERVVCGHWAALGLVVRDEIVALDSGCAWGGKLTAWRLEDGRIEQTENLDR